MNSQRMKCSVLIAALFAATGAVAQTTAQPQSPATRALPPDDTIRLPRSVATPEMPVVVEPSIPTNNDATLRSLDTGTDPRVNSPTVDRSANPTMNNINRSTALDGTGAPVGNGGVVNNNDATPSNPSSNLGTAGGTNSLAAPGSVNGSTTSGGVQGNGTPSGDNPYAAPGSVNGAINSSGVREGSNGTTTGTMLGPPIFDS